MTKQTNRSHYAHVWPNWQTKVHGPQPTEAQLAVAHVFGRPGKQALGIALSLRDNGMTTAQMTGTSALFDGKPTPCRNKLIGAGGLVACGLFKREPMPGVIKLTITAAGQQWVDKAADAANATPKADKAGKAEKPVSKPRKAGKRKPKQVPAAPAEVPQAEVPQADNPAPQADTPTGDTVQVS